MPVQEASLPIRGEKSSSRQPGQELLILSLLSFTLRNILTIIGQIFYLSAREGGESCPLDGGERRLLVGYEETRRREEESEVGISGGGGEVIW